MSSSTFILEETSVNLCHNEQIMTLEAQPSLSEDLIVYLPLPNVGSGFPSLIRVVDATYTVEDGEGYEVIFLEANTPRTVTLIPITPGHTKTFVDASLSATTNQIQIGTITLHSNGACATMIYTSNGWITLASFTG